MTYLTRETDLRRHIEQEHNISMTYLSAKMREHFTAGLAEIKERDLPLIHGAAHGREEQYRERMELHSGVHLTGGHIHVAMPEWDDHVEQTR